MESKNLFLFVFIFLINTKILVYSEDNFGSISLTFSEDVPFIKSEDNKVIIKCQSNSCSCSISFQSDFKDFSYLFEYYNLAGMETVDLSNLKIKPNNLKGMFADCGSLEKIEGLSKLNTSEVTDMSEMFTFCNSLSEIDLSNFDTSSVKDMSYMFYGVNSEIINVTNFKTSLVEDMSYMFGKEQNSSDLNMYFDNKEERPIPPKLEIIGLTNFDTSKVTNMENMFCYLVGLSSLDLSSFNTSLVENMVGMFGNCISLKSLDISNFNLNNITYDGTFTGVKLKYINIYNVSYNSSESDF